MTQDMLNMFLVDENYGQLQELKRILEEAGQHEITTFEDELECIQQLDRNPDLIFLNHNLSTFSGYAVLRKIKFFNPKINVVIVSAQADIRIIADSIKFGALDYINKNENLELQVNRVLKNVMAMRQVQHIPQQAPSLFKKLFRFF